MRQSQPGIRAIDIAKAIDENPYLLVPVTVDPMGQLGPLAANLFWAPSTMPTTCLPCSDPPQQGGLTSHASTNLRDKATQNPVHLLTRATKEWNKTHQNTPPLLRPWFAPHYTTTTPRQWGTQVLSHNITFAITRHLQASLNRLPQSGAPNLPPPRIAALHPTTIQAAISFPTTFHFPGPPAD